MKAKQFTKETINEVGVSDRKFPEFKVGDTIAVSQRIKEGDKERIQVFQGDVIAERKGKISTTFTVRKIGANSVSVERIYPYYSPLIEGIKVIKHGKIRRAKLFYIRDRIGKSARIKENILTHEQKEQKAKAHNNDAKVAPKVEKKAPKSDSTSAE